MSGYPEEWMRELNDQQAFITDPAGRCAELSAMANDLHRRGEIDADQLGDMLEFTDAGREWGLQEQHDG